jgi:hypothetical protein
VVSRKRARSATPALFTTMSMEPNSSTIRATMACVSERSAMSARQASARPPAAAISATTFSAASALA